MANVKNLKIGNTSYNIVDDKALHQSTTALSGQSYPNGYVYQYMGTDTDTLKHGSIYINILETHTPSISGITYDDTKFTSVTIDITTFMQAYEELIGGWGKDGLFLVWYNKPTQADGTWILGEDDTHRTWGPSAGFTLAGFGITIVQPSGHPVNSDGFRFTVDFGRLQYWKSNVVNDIVDNITTENSNKALSAKQGYVLKNMIENVGSLGRFLAMWDADTGIARYLSTGFQYQRGDYFIVAQVSADPTLSAYYHGSMTITGTKPNNWRNYFPDTTANVTMTYSSADDEWTGSGVTIGGQDIGDLVTFSEPYMHFYNGDYITFNYYHAPNYMPTGDTYTGPSTTLATDYLYVSDVYYYDSTHWVYMANHAKQIAVDEALSTTSKNPVENRVVTNAINGKQAKLTAGTNITIDEDNVISATGGGSGTGLPCITDVSVKQDSKYIAYGDDYLGEYSMITFTTNMDKDQLVEKMNDLYVGVSRYKRTTQRSEYNGSGNRHKMVVQNDQRFKLNKRLYCWRYYDTNEAPEILDPRSYYYYYTENDYPTVQALFDADPDVYMYCGYDFESDRATCLNVLDFDRSQWTISDAGYVNTITRYTAGDVDTFVPRDGYKDYVIRMLCKEATKDGQRYFLWCDDWADSSSFVYGTNTAETIPDHFDTLVIVTKSEYTLGNDRPDLNYFKLNEDSYRMYEFVEFLYGATMGDGEYPLDTNQHNWQCYPFDYPLTPIRLADCEVLVSAGSAIHNNVQYRGQWIKLKTIKDMNFFNDLRQIVFRYKYNTAEMWMRFSSWQKRCMYQSLNDEIELDMSYKNTWHAAVAEYNGNPNYAFSKRAFGRQRNCYKSYWNGRSKICEYIEFNLLEGDDIVHGLTSKSTPIQKRLVSQQYRSTIMD